MGRLTRAASGAASSAVLASKADLVGGVVPTSQLPASIMTDAFVVGSEAAMLALAANKGDLAIRSDLSRTFVLAANAPGVLANWIRLETPASPVLSVQGQTGVIVIGKSDIGLGNADNTRDADKPVSTATATALAAKANAAHAHAIADVAGLQAGLDAKANTSSLAPVATSGAYSALTDSPFVFADWATSATPNPATNGLAAVDSTTFTAGQRVLLTASGVSGGIWVVGAGAWTRATDHDSDAEIRQRPVRVRSWTGSGVGFGATIQNTNTAAITVGTTSITYAPAIIQSGNRVREGFWGASGEMGYEGFAGGGTATTHTMVRATGANGAWTFTNGGTGVFGLIATGGVRLGNAGANPVFDLRAGTAAIPANTSVAAGADYDLSITVAGALNNFGLCSAGTQGVVVPAGLVQTGVWCVTNGTIVARYRNVTAAAVAWPATATNVRALWFSI